eukprot:scaffold1054_cov116-Isochrysis_galbana.AAC.34
MQVPQAPRALQSRGVTPRREKDERAADVLDERGAVFGPDDRFCVLVDGGGRKPEAPGRRKPRLAQGPHEI